MIGSLKISSENIIRVCISMVSVRTMELSLLVTVTFSYYKTLLARFL